MSKKHLIAAAAISSALLLGGCSSSSQTDLDDQPGTTVARTKNAALLPNSRPPELPLPPGKQSIPRPGIMTTTTVNAVALPSIGGSTPQPEVMTTTTVNAVALPSKGGSTPQPEVMTTTTVAPSTSSTTTQATTTPTQPLCPVSKIILSCQSTFFAK